MHSKNDIRNALQQIRYIEVFGARKCERTGDQKRKRMSLKVMYLLCASLGEGGGSSCNQPLCGDHCVITIYIYRGSVNGRE